MALSKVAAAVASALPEVSPEVGEVLFARFVP